MPAHAVSDDEKLQLFVGDKGVLVCFADRSDVAETARFDHVSDSRWFRQICQPGRLRRSLSAVIREANATLVVLSEKGSGDSRPLFYARRLIRRVRESTPILSKVRVRCSLVVA